LTGELGHSGHRALDALHDLQLDILELALTTGKRLNLVLKVLQLLGISDGSAVEQLLIVK
jgi:hypothetical protein